MIEADQVSPSVSALAADALGARASASPTSSPTTEAPGEPVVFRADELTEIAGGAVSYRQVGAEPEGPRAADDPRALQARRASGPKMLSHQGEEAGLVIKGRLGLEVDGRRYELGPGDAYVFDSRKPHAFRNIGGERSRDRLRLHAADVLTPSSAGAARVRLSRGPGMAIFARKAPPQYRGYLDRFEGGRLMAGLTTAWRRKSGLSSRSSPQALRSDRCAR